MPSSSSQNHASEEEQNHTIPATFLEWTVYNAYVNHEGEPEMTETALLQDIQDYTTYLRDGPFHLDHLASFVQQVSRLHSSDEANFDFLPSSSQEVLGFRSWVELTWSENITKFSENADYMRPEATRHQRFNRTVALYAQHLVDCGAVADREELITSRNWLAENNRRELNNLCRMDHTYGAEDEWILVLENADMPDFDVSANESSLPEHQTSIQSSGEELSEGENISIEQQILFAALANWDPQLGGSVLAQVQLDAVRLAFQRAHPQNAGEANYQELLREYIRRFVRDQIHDIRVALMRRQRSEPDEGENDEDGDDEVENNDENNVEREDVPMTPEIPSLPQQPWFHPLEIREIIEDAVREAMEEETRMDESTEDEDDLERQGRRPWRLVRPIRTRRQYFD